MPSPPGEPSSEIWDLALDLFDRALDAEDPAAVIAAEPNLEVQALARHLLTQHHAAESEGFLQESPAPVKSLWLPESQVFADASLLVDGRFEVVRLVGKGGMGEVYLARDRKLDEDVALKTIRRQLASNPAILRQFIAEIQSARRVNHRNVCRIHDLFNHLDTPLFSMEYLPGERLSDKLTNNSLSPADRKATALQLAEGLAQLHERGILHRDFKPANVIFDPSGQLLRAVIMDFGLAQRVPVPGAPSDALRAGTVRYMAPEVLAGAPGTIKSDIFAFGKVLAELLPGDPWAHRCQSPDPLQRPASLTPVIAHLNGHNTRRTWLRRIAAGTIAAAATYAILKPAKIQFNGRQGLVLNGFRSNTGNPALATTMRRLVITALNQSPLLQLISEETLVATLAQLRLPKDLPVDARYLRAAATQRNVPLVAEGTISALGSAGLRLLLTIFERNSDHPLITVDRTVSDASNLVQLAEDAAVSLREDIGESGSAFNATHTDLSRATSKSPEAVEDLYLGIELYEHSQTDDALVLFKKAIEYDPNFALAYAYAGLALGARNSLEESLASYQRAFDLRKRVSTREQLWIERGYYNATGNIDACLDTCKQLTTLYPEDPTFQKNLAFAYAFLGRPQEGLVANRKAVELNPAGDSMKAELIVNLAQANQTGDALQTFAQFRAAGTASTQLDFGAGIAHLCAGEPAAASRSFENMRTRRKDENQGRLYACGTLLLCGRFREAQMELKGDLSRDLATPYDEPYNRQVRLLWLAGLDWLTGIPQPAAARLETLLQLPLIPAYMTLLNEAGVIALRTGNESIATAALEHLKTIESRWPSTQSKGSRLNLEGAIRDAQTQDPADLLFGARGNWPDPLTLTSLRDCFVRRQQWPDARKAAEALHEDRGRLFKRYCPAWFLLNQLEHAKILQQLALHAEAVRVYDQLLKNLDAEADSYPMFRNLRTDAARTKRLAAQGENHG